MDTKFTQGTWHYNGKDSIYPFSVIDSKGHDVCALPIGAARAMRDGSIFEVEANAYLIAAAPELYQALLDLTLMAQAWQTDFAAINRDSPDYDPNYKVEYNKETLAALDALAKARGEQ